MKRVFGIKLGKFGTSETWFCVYILGVDYYVNPYPGTSWLF